MITPTPATNPKSNTHSMGDGASSSSSSCQITMNNLRNFFEQYSPQPREFGPDLQRLFDVAFHQDIRFVVNGQDYGYDFMLNQVTQIFVVGSTIEQLEMRMIDDTHFWYTMSYSQQDRQYNLRSIASVDTTSHQVLRVEPMKGSVSASYEDIFDHNTSIEDNDAVRNE